MVRCDRALSKYEIYPGSVENSMGTFDETDGRREREKRNKKMKRLIYGISVEVPAADGTKALAGPVHRIAPGW